MVTSVLEAKRRARRNDCIEHSSCVFGSDVQLPAQFANKRDTACTHTGVTQVDDLRGSEWERFVRHVCVSKRLQKCARVGAHDAEHSHARRDIGERCFCTCRNVILQPLEVAHLRCCCSNHHVFVGGFPGNGEVGFDAATLVEPLRVHQLADGNRHVVCRNVVDDRFGVFTFQDKFAER